MHACFEILGFDILLDHKLRPYILEVNHSPSFHTDTQLDREVKDSLLTDTFSMLNVWQCDKRRVLDEDRRRIRERLLQTNKYANFTPQDDKEPEKSPWQIQVQWEETHLGNFRRVYPVGERYAALFEQPMGSLYSGTAASRARGDCTRIQLEEFQQSKAKAEALKIPSQPRPLKDLQQQDLVKQKSAEPSQPTFTSVAYPTIAASVEKSPKNNTRTEREQKRKKEKEDKEDRKDKEKEKRENEKEKTEQEKSKLTSKQLTQNSLRAQSHINSKLELWTRAHEKIYYNPKETKSPCVSSSYEPGRIVEREERERINLLAQRDFLIKSYGMLEQVYLVMKKLGTLRPEDERKYGVYGRLSTVTNTPKAITKDQKNKETAELK